MPQAGGGGQNNAVNKFINLFLQPGDGMTHAQLKAFHAVALTGSVQDAAERLSLTQPAVSVQLKALEADSGKLLFRKAGHRLELSAEGQALFIVTRQMFRAEAEARQLLSPDSRHTGSLVIGADGPHVALDLIAEFRSRYPQVKVETLFSNAEHTWLNLLNLQVDVAVLAGSPAHQRVHKQLAARQSLMALLSADHVLAGADSLTLEQLSEEVLIFREQGSNTQQKLAAALAERQLHVQPGLVMGSREAVFEAVVRKMGVGFLYNREVNQDPRVRAVPVAGMEAVNWDEVVCLKNGRQNPHVAAFFDCIQE